MNAVYAVKPIKKRITVKGHVENHFAINAFQNIRGNRKISAQTDVQLRFTSKSLNLT